MNIFGNKKVIPDVDDEEPEFQLDVTSGESGKSSGFEFWRLWTRKRRLEHDFDDEGVITRRDLYEYDVRATSLFLRLLERSDRWDEPPVFTVFGGSILHARLEADYSARAREYEPGGRWQNGDPEMKELVLQRTPAIAAEELGRMIVWHEAFAAVRYFTLSHHCSVEEHRAFFLDESRRFKSGSAAFAKQVQELGAIWNPSRDCFHAPDDATTEEKAAVDSRLRIYNFGFRNHHEFRERDVILKVLNEAIAKP